MTERFVRILTECLHGNVVLVGIRRCRADRRIAADVRTGDTLVSVRRLLSHHSTAHTAATAVVGRAGSAAARTE